jgi:hypothetical protein
MVAAPSDKPSLSDAIERVRKYAHNMKDSNPMADHTWPRDVLAVCDAAGRAAHGEPDASLRNALTYIRDAKRFNRKHFTDDTEFANWAQSWARHALLHAAPTAGSGQQKATEASGSSPQQEQQHDDESNGRCTRGLASEGNESDVQLDRRNGPQRCDRSGEHGAGLLHPQQYADSRRGDAADNVAAPVAPAIPDADAELLRMLPVLEARDLGIAEFHAMQLPLADRIRSLLAERADKQGAKL